MTYTPREYWSEQMELAFAFMEAMRRYPLEESHEPLASLESAVEGLEVAFSGTLINKCHPRVYFIREGLIPQFRAVARQMNERGWVLKVEDGYRSPEMQRAQSHNPANFDLVLKKVIWELDGAIPTPELMLRRLSAVIATRCRIGTHISGSAIDISVLDRTTGEAIDRGGGYIEFSERTPMASPFITPSQQQAREEINTLMQRHGWYAYPYEYWHFSAGDCYAESLSGAGRPARYGPVRFDGACSEPIPFEESDQLLEPVEFYNGAIAAALERLRLHV